MRYNKIIVNRITDLCKRRGISYNKLTNMSNLHQSTVDNIVRGMVKDPRIITLHRIALGFGMTLSEFLDYEELNDFSFDDEDDDFE